MLALALGMLKGLKNLKEMEVEEFVPFAVTVVMTVFTQNIAYGAAAVCIVFTGSADVDYYTIWVYGLDDEGNEGSSYAAAMGPMTKYSCEKEITVETGEYKICLTATGDGNLAEVSEESEQIELTVADGTASEGQTSNYFVSEGGPMP